MFLNQIVSVYVKEIYSELKSTILSLGTDITIKPTKTYIGFRRHATFSWIHITQSGIRVDFNVKSSQLKDPERIAREAYKGNISVINVSQPNQVPYTQSLIKQAYERS